MSDPQIEEKDKRRIFRHWARPTRLQYNILYDYQHNYYSDYISYMDRRQRGLYDPVPEPRTWEERVLRTCTKDGRRLSSSDFPLTKSKLNDYVVIPSVCRADHDKHFYYRQYYDQLIGTPWYVKYFFFWNVFLYKRINLQVLVYRYWNMTIYYT